MIGNRTNGGNLGERNGKWSKKGSRNTAVKRHIMYMNIIVCLPRCGSSHTNIFIQSMCFFGSLPNHIHTHIPHTQLIFPLGGIKPYFYSFDRKVEEEVEGRKQH